MFPCRFLLPIELEKARLQYLLSGASGEVYVTRQSHLGFLLEFNFELTREDLQCLMATVGEKVILKHDGHHEKLFVTALAHRGLILTYPVDADFTSSDTCGSTHNRTRVGPGQFSFLARPRRLKVWATFYVSSLTYKVMETAVVDGVSALGEDWFGVRHVFLIGLPLVGLHLISVYAFHFIGFSCFRLNWNASSDSKREWVCSTPWSLTSSSRCSFWHCEIRWSGASTFVWVPLEPGRLKC